MNHSTTASGTQAATGSAAARVAAGSRERSDPRVVLADRVEQLYSQLPLGIAATVVIGLISALELREGRIIELVAFWGGLLLLVPLFYGVSVVIAYRLNRVFHSGYRLRHAYGKLTEDYSVLNQRLEMQLVELEEARRQVEASGRKLALFAERAPIAVLEIDPQGIVTAVNHAAELLFGYAAAELIGGHVKRLVVPESHAEFDGHWMRMTETRQPLAGLRIRNPRRDGIALVCEWTVTPLVNPEGDIVSVIAQGQDVTRQ